LSIWITIGAIAILLLISAFLSGSETALTAVSRARLLAKSRSGSKRAITAQKLTEDKERLIGALLLGNNLVNILASALATSVLITLFGDGGVIYATIIMTLCVVIFAEVLPKTLAINQPDNFALRVAPILKPFIAILSPFTLAIQAIVRLLLRIFGVKTNDIRSGLTGLEEIRGTVDLLHHEGEVVKSDRDMLGGILNIKDLEVFDIMVHRTKIIALDIELPSKQLVNQVLKSPYTRMPLFKGETDNIIGLVHAKDVLRALIKAKGNIDEVNIEKIATKPWFIPDTTPLEAQLNAFLKGKSHFALVVDEYGEMQGLITLEDILEEIVGDISDEHDDVIEGISKQLDGSFIIDGSLAIRDVNRALDWNLPEEEATTIAGLIIHEAKTIPDQAQQFTFHNFRFKVLQKTGNRLTKLSIATIKSN
jgi:Mg2+/Co2+ transporter CorB